MLHFVYKKKNKLPFYDKTGKKPILHCSIRTGEQVAGFKNLSTGNFEGLMVIHCEKDLRTFLQQYGVSRDELTKEY